MNDVIVAKAMNALNRSSVQSASEWVDHCLRNEVLATGEDAVAYNRAGIVSATVVAIKMLKQMVNYCGRFDTDGTMLHPHSILQSDLEQALRAYLDNSDKSENLFYMLQYVASQTERVGQQFMSRKLEDMARSVVVYAQLAQSGLLIQNRKN